MPSTAVVLTRAPLALPPAVRVIEPVLLSMSAQDPLLPWVEPPRPTPAALPEVTDALHRRVTALVAAVVEVLRGRRPLAHLEFHCDDSVFELLGQLLACGALPQLRLASTQITRPAESAVEASARLTLGDISRAAAFRIARKDGRWLLTDLELALDDATTQRSRLRPV
ncbi:MAG: Rv3235 family protein [Micropruina sp.]